MAKALAFGPYLLRRPPSYSLMFSGPASTPVWFIYEGEREVCCFPVTSTATAPTTRRDAKLMSMAGELAYALAELLAANPELVQTQAGVKARTLLDRINMIEGTHDE